MDVGTRGLDHEARAIHRDIWWLVYALVTTWIVLDRFVPDLFVLPIGIDMGPAEGALVVLGLVLTVALVTSSRPWPHGPGPLAGMVLFVTVVVSAFLWSSAHDLYQADGARRGVFLAIMYVVLFLAVYFVSQTERWATALLNTIVIMTTWQAVILIAEWVTGTGIALKSPIWGMLGLDTSAVGRGDVARLTGLFRPQGTSPHPIVASSLMALGVLIVAALLLDSRPLRAKRWILASLFPITLALFLVNTRTGFVILLTGMIVVLAMKARSIPRLMPLVIPGMIGMGIIGALSPDSLRSSLDMFARAGQDSSVTLRVDRLARVPELIGESPLLGRGWLTSDPSYLLFDNAWIMSLIELGIVGTGIVLVFLIANLGRMWKARTITSDIESTLVICGIAAVQALIVAGLTFDAFSFDQFLPTNLLLIAMGVSAADNAIRRERFPLSGGSSEPRKARSSP